MPKAYSQDLRDKAVAAVDRGVPKSEVTIMFNISRDSLDRWLKRGVLLLSKGINGGTVTALLIGTSFGRLSNNMVTRPKQN
jgi:transposase